MQNNISLEELADACIHSLMFGTATINISTKHDRGCEQKILDMQLNAERGYRFTCFDVNTTAEFLSTLGTRLSTRVMEAPHCRPMSNQISLFSQHQ